MPNFSLYMLFAFLPFWHVRLFDYISLYEAAVLVSLLSLPVSGGRLDVRWSWMDALVFLFALYGVLSVAVGSGSAYESMRVYRYVVLGPVLLYFLVRVAQPSAEQLARALLVFSLVVATQAIAVIYYVVTHGERPANTVAWELYKYSEMVPGIVTFSVLAVMASAGSLYRALQSSGVRRYALLGVGLVCGVGLLASATRASAIGFVLFFPLSGWFMRRKTRRLLLVTGAYILLFSVIVAVAAVAVTGADTGLRDGGSVETRRAIDRVVDVDKYKADIFGRIAFWESLVRQGMSSPLVGQGMASFDIGTRGGTGFHVSSAHNVLVSTFYTSGLIGVVLLILLWAAAFRCIYHMNILVPGQAWRVRFLSVSVMVMLLVSLTNDMTAGRGNLFMLLLALLVQTPGDTVGRGGSVEAGAEPMRGRPRILARRAAGVGDTQ